MSFSVSKDDIIFIPILIMNRSKELWGEDAFEFKYVTSLVLLAFSVDICALL